MFVAADGRVGFTDKITHRINTGDAEPIKVRVRKSSYVERDKITEEVTKMLNEGQISPSNMGNWCGSCYYRLQTFKQSHKERCLSTAKDRGMSRQIRWKQILPSNGLLLWILASEGASRRQGKDCFYNPDRVV